LLSSSSKHKFTLIYRKYHRIGALSMEPRFVIKSPLIAMGSDVILQPGDTITETESALDIEELISKYAFGDV